MRTVYTIASLTVLGMVLVIMMVIPSPFGAAAKKNGPDSVVVIKPGTGTDKTETQTETDGSNKTVSEPDTAAATGTSTSANGANAGTESVAIRNQDAKTPAKAGEKQPKPRPNGALHREPEKAATDASPVVLAAKEGDVVKGEFTWVLVEENTEVLTKALRFFGAHEVWIDANNVVYDSSHNPMPEGLLGDLFLPRPVDPRTKKGGEFKPYFAFRDKVLKDIERFVTAVHISCYQSQNVVYNTRLKADGSKYYVLPTSVTQKGKTTAVPSECLSESAKELGGTNV